MELREMMLKLEDLEDEYQIFKTEMINAIIESERAMRLMSEKESEIASLKMQVEIEISNN